MQLRLTKLVIMVDEIVMEIGRWKIFGIDSNVSSGLLARYKTVNLVSINWVLLEEGVLGL